MLRARANLLHRQALRVSNWRRFSTQDHEQLVEKLRKWQDDAKTRANTQIATWSTSAQHNLALLGSKINEMTGYTLVEELKRHVVEQEGRIEQARVASREAKQAYEKAVAERSQCQREVNDLLQRKSSWTDADVVRFTNLVRQDHLNEQEEARAKREATRTDEAIEQEFQNLTRAILNRYHEEQVWSDKIRSASTYGSLLALGLNLVVFIMAIVVVEPYKRRRMGETFEKRVEALSLESKELINSVSTRMESHFQKQEDLLSPLVAPPVVEDSPEDDSKPHRAYIVTIPAERRDQIAAAAGALAALTVCGVVSLVRNR